MNNSKQRFWLKAGQDIWEWDGQYVNVLKIDSLLNRAMIEANIINEQGTSRKIYTLVSADKLQAEDLIYEENKLKVYENDIIQNNLSGELFRVVKNDNQSYVIIGVNEKEEANVFMKFVEWLGGCWYEVVGNKNENPNMWQKCIEQVESKKNEEVNQHATDEQNSEIITVEDCYILIGKNIELTEENIKLKKENQFAEHYLEQAYKDKAEKDKLIYSLQKENKKLKEETKSFEQESNNESFDFFDEIMRMFDNYGWKKDN